MKAFKVAKLGGFMSCSSKDIFKNAPSRVYTHHDVTDLVNHEMVSNTKT